MSGSRSVAALGWRTAVVLLACFWTNPARPAPGLSNPGSESLRVEARAGDVHSVTAAKIGGEYRLRLQRPSGLEERNLVWRQPSLIAMSWMALEDGTYTVSCERLGGASSPACALAVTRIANAASATARAAARSRCN